MMRIALCDDDKAFLEKTSIKIKEFFRQQGMGTDVVCFTSGEVLLNCLSVEAEYDLVLLDIEMPGQNGMQVARKLREMHIDVLIIFLTSFIGFAPEAFEVEAFRFITKFRMEEKLPKALGAAMEKLRESREKTLTVSRYNDMRRVAYRDISYVLRVNRTLEIVIPGKEGLICRKGIKQLFEQLADRRFVFVDRGCFVNIDYFQEISGAVLRLTDGTCFTVSRLHLQKVKQEINRAWGVEE